MISTQQPYGSSKKMMTPMESLLSAIDNAHPIHLPFPSTSTSSTKRPRQSSPQQSMSIENMLDLDQQ